MLNLIRSDLYKVFHMKSFYVCGILCVLISIINTIGMGKEAVIPFCDIIGLAGSPLLTLLLTIFSAFFVVAEYKRGYIKNIAGNIPDKAMLVISKLTINAVVMLIYFAIIFISGFIFNEISYKISYADFTAEQYIYQALTLLFLNFAVAALVTMISVGVQGNSGASVTMAVVISGSFMAETIWMIVTLLQVAEIINNDFEIMKYFATTYIDMFASGYTPESVDIALIVGGVYIVLSTVLTILHIKKKDI